jgi:hypothetical protein
MGWMPLCSRQVGAVAERASMPSQRSRKMMSLRSESRKCLGYVIDSAGFSASPFSPNSLIRLIFLETEVNFTSLILLGFP